MPMPSKPLPDFTAQEVKRFWSYVDKRRPDECWPWTGALCGRGYAQFIIRRSKGPSGRMRFGVHRVALFLGKGEDPYPLFALHSCDNPPCCNPAHLRKGTHLENMREMVQKGRSAKGDRVSTRRGTECHLSKLTDYEVMDIRKMREDGFLFREIAARFNISKRHAQSITAREYWKTVP